MKISKKLLSFYFPFILFMLVYTGQGYSQYTCENYAFNVDLKFTIPAAGCDGSNCLLYTAQEELGKQYTRTYKRLSTDSAARICAQRSCPPNETCQVIADDPPDVYHKICTSDTSGNHWCTYKLHGYYICTCVGNKVGISASNTTGNYCPGDNVVLTAIPDSPIPNIEYIQWFRDNALLYNDTTMTHVVSSIGIYKVLIVDTDGIGYLSPAFPVQCASAIPTLQQWTLIILAVLLLIIGVMVILRNKRRSTI